MSDFLGYNAPKSFSAGAPPQTPLGELTARPRPPNRIKGGLLLREEEGIWEGRGRGGKGGEQRGGDGRGRDGKGGHPNILLHPSSSFLEICLPRPLSWFRGWDPRGKGKREGKTGRGGGRWDWDPFTRNWKGGEENGGRMGVGG